MKGLLREQSIGERVTVSRTFTFVANNTRLFVGDVFFGGPRLGAAGGDVGLTGLMQSASEGVIGLKGVASPGNTK